MTPLFRREVVPRKQIMRAAEDAVGVDGAVVAAEVFAVFIREHDEVLEQATINRIRDLRVSDASVREIARLLTAEGHLTKRGGTRWHPTTVARLVARLGET